MIVVQRTAPGRYVEIPPDGVIVDSKDNPHPWSWVREVNDEDLAAIGVYKVMQLDTPVGKVRTGYEIVEQRGVPVMQLQLVDAPPPLPPPRRSVRKLLVTDRLIAAGLVETVLAGFAANPIAKLRWDSAIDLWADDAQVRGLLTAIGADPDVILAPE